MHDERRVMCVMSLSAFVCMYRLLQASYMDVLCDAHMQIVVVESV